MTATFGHSRNRGGRVMTETTRGIKRFPRCALGGPLDLVFIREEILWRVTIVSTFQQHFSRMDTALWS